MQAHSLSYRAASSYGLEPVGLAHDAGNLLNALGLYCDLLDGPEVLRAEHRHYVVELRGIARRSAELLGKLVAPDLRLAQEEGLSRLSSFEGVLREICGKGCRFSMEIGAVLPPAPVDVEVVERIVLNLVRNAAEALERKRISEGEVRVWLRGEQGDLVLTVEDNGPGMDPLMAARFLQPSRQGHGGGRGIGRTVLRELAQETGADFEMRVRPGKGCTFSFRWKNSADGGDQPAC